MKSRVLVYLALSLGTLAAAGQTTSGADFKLALAVHTGQIKWKAEGFKIVESSAKPDGLEIGIRGQDGTGQVGFLGFLFALPGNEPATSAKCRDAILDPEKANDPTLKVARMSEIARPDIVPVSLVDYTAQGKGGNPVNSVRGFVASGNVCGDLEFYSSEAIRSTDPDLLKVFQSFQLDVHYQPVFNDSFFYAQVLYNSQQFAAAAPIFERALAQLKDAKGIDTKSMRRVVTDQAGMSYGMSGDTKKARALFEQGIAQDPDYPTYYYNLACADAQEKNLADAKKHLQQAFERKANVLRGENLPDPTADDSFTPYQSDKEFWSFLAELRAKK